MATSRKIHANTNSNPAPKNSKTSGKFRFSAKKLLVANVILTIAVASTLDIYGCLQNVEKPSKPAKEPASLSSPDSFTVTKTERISVHNSLKTFPSGTSKSLALVVDAGKKVLENEPCVLSEEGYSHVIDEFLKLYEKVSVRMTYSAIAQSGKLPESKRMAFLDEAQLTIVALALRPFAAWEGPLVLKELDQLISSPEFNQDSMDNFAADYDLLNECYEITMNIRTHFYF